MVITAQDTKIKPGYKQTEVGVIPEDWNTEILIGVCIPGGLVRGPFGGTIKKQFFVKDGFKVYEQRNAIYRDADLGSYFICESKYKELKRFEVKEGDFIISCSGTIGKIFQIPKNAKAGVINQALLKIKTDNRVIHDQFFFYVFDWDRFQQKIIDNTQGGAMQNLVGMDVFRNIPIPLPPLPEQRAIATALSDIDALIISLDKLIAKKRDIKQATMQQLLTGKTRLPGFSGEWEMKKLGEVIKFTSGKPYEKFVRDDGRYFLITLDSISIDGKIKKEHKMVNFFDGSLCKNDIIIMLDDVAHGDFLGLCDLIPEDNKYVLNQRVGRLKTIATVSPKFLSLLINYNQDHFKKRGQGTSQRHIYKRDIEELSILIPKFEEQTVIAAVLSDMDAEIAALEQKRDKTRALKQGMMQELLTGKTRLVTP